MLKREKIAFILSACIVISICMINIVYADNFNAGVFEGKGEDSSANKIVLDVLGTATTTIRIIGTGIAIIMLSYIAIKYMIASAQEKAEFKKSITIYVIGAVLVFASSQILSAIIDFANNSIVYKN